MSAACRWLPSLTGIWRSGIRADHKHDGRGGTWNVGRKKCFHRFKFKAFGKNWFCIRGEYVSISSQTHVTPQAKKTRKKKQTNIFFVVCLCWLCGCRLWRVPLLFLFGGADWFDNFGVTSMDDIDRLQSTSLPLIFKNGNNQQKHLYYLTKQNKTKKEFLKAVKYTEIPHCSHSPEQWHPVIYQMWHIKD